MTTAIAKAALRQMNRVVEPIVKTGVSSLVPVGPALVLLETIGRRSRRVRTVPVLALRFGSRVVVGTVRRNSSWLANVDATPSATIWWGGSRRTGPVTMHHEGIIDVASIVIEPAGDAHWP